MEDNLYNSLAKNEQNSKKVWQTPTIEIISRDHVQSGHTTGIEGVVYNPGSTGSGHS